MAQWFSPATCGEYLRKYIREERGWTPDAPISDDAEVFKANGQGKPDGDFLNFDTEQIVDLAVNIGTDLLGESMMGYQDHLNEGNLECTPFRQLAARLAQLLENIAKDEAFAVIQRTINPKRPTAVETRDALPKYADPPNRFLHDLAFSLNSSLDEVDPVDEADLAAVLESAPKTAGGLINPLMKMIGDLLDKRLESMTTEV